MSFPSRRKDVEREERRIERVRREDAAGRLLQKAPDLVSLNLDMSETRPEGCVSNNHYIRRIVVEHAPALFQIPCSYPQCEDGGYDVTSEILHALSMRKTRFEGERSCGGRCASIDCARVLRYVGTATYREAPAYDGVTNGSKPRVDGPFLR